MSAAGGEVDDDDSVIAVRTVAADGRSRAHVGGRSVPVGVLGQITTSLLTIHVPERPAEAAQTGASAQRARHLRRCAGSEGAHRLPLGTGHLDGILDELEQRRGNMRELAQGSGPTALRHRRDRRGRPVTGRGHRAHGHDPAPDRSGTIGRRP